MSQLTYCLSCKEQGITPEHSCIANQLKIAQQNMNTLNKQINAGNFTVKQGMVNGFLKETPKPEIQSGATQSQGAARFDTGKMRLDLLSPIAMQGTAAVLAFGAKKYAEGNWQKGMNWRRAIGSLLRHTMQFMTGEDLDQESGLPHVDHIACNAMFLQEYFRTHKELDDRFKHTEAPKEKQSSDTFVTTTTSD